MTIPSDLEDKRAALEALLGRFSSIAVAFSGGVDSTLLLKVARDVLGSERVLALTVASAFFPEWELAESRRLAEKIGIRQEILHGALLERPEIVANGANRCYHCKRAVMVLCMQEAHRLGYTDLVDGSNHDDLGDYRPGTQALKELGISSPLLEAGLSKPEVRELSRKLGLPTAAKPAFACLATRIPFGQPLSLKNLAQVEACEDFLRQLELYNFRARHHGDTVRIELTERDLPLLLEKSLRSKLIDVCKKAGFRYVTLDLEGYRTGRMNEELP